MPITFTVANHEAAPAKWNPYNESTPTGILQGCSHKSHEKCEQLIQSSFDKDDCQNSVPTNNGFVRAALDAYNQHHNLIMRPDDVWLAIITQFNIFVNAHAEELRHLFVAHDGQKELEVIELASTGTYDWACFPLKISEMIEKNVVDPGLREWIIPKFTTTTSTDEVVCSIVMMSTLQAYFSYKCCLLCGIPSVTLEGERSDWVNILSRLDKLASFGAEPLQWVSLLKPVISRCIASFDNPSSNENVDFWQKIAHHRGGGSGPTWLSGWITAFCFWDTNGRMLYPGQDAASWRRRPWRDVLCLDEVKFHWVDTTDIPQGWASVPIKVDDNGYKYDAEMLAGHVSMRHSKSGLLMIDGNPVNDTVQPEAGWFMYKIKESAKKTKEKPLA